jgi:hypothetical protein
VEANSTGGQGSRRAVAPSDDDDDELGLLLNFGSSTAVSLVYVLATARITLYECD